MEPKFYIQLVLVILITLFFIWQFIRNKKIFQLLIAIWAPITMLAYVPMNATCTIILAVIELLFFLTVIFLLFKSSKSNVKNVTDDMLEKTKANTADNNADKADADTIVIEESKE